MKFADIRAAVDTTAFPPHLTAATTPARPKSTTTIRQPPAWYGARMQMARDQLNQQPARSRRQRKTRKPRVGRWK